MSDLYSKRIDLSSGFTVKVQPLAPYYADFIEDNLPLAEYPMRKITLAGGDILDFEYVPPDSQPAVDDTVEYELYMEWHSVKVMNDDILKARERAKRDFLLASCVKIIYNPPGVTLESNDWVEMLEAAFDNYVVPVHPGKRTLAFLKAYVIRTTEDYTQIIQAALFPEVTMQGITNALRGFQDNVERPKPRRRHRAKA
jgi:hypothetical protein